MPISSEHRVVFIHIPKNAGSSIEEAFAIKPSKQSLLSKNYSSENIYAMQHLPFDHLKHIVPKHEWDTYVKVAVVRNPWDRIVSDWHWRKKHSLPLGDLAFPEFVQYATSLVCLPKWDENTNIKEFQKNYLGHFTQQVAFTGPESSGVHILKYESLSREWGRFCQDVLHRELPLPVTNESNRGKRHYSDEFEGNKSLIDKVAVAYKHDIDRFGYTFDTPKMKKSFNNLLKGFNKKEKKRKLDQAEGGEAESHLPSKSKTTDKLSKAATQDISKGASQEKDN